ncbi:MAG: ECF transporter S component [Aminivibrio sp.]|uniref:ECF transporter S component n=1 Tax=Aminivibrio sp. TaxID=1872489 RepID=UPI002B213768|nr:ECF transporter S component [Aminivibrio sp.]MEA4952870.1 ECF transporter S component [Aminivibrio sp.]
MMKNRTLVLIALCIALNIGLGQAASTLKLPIFLDSIGTVLAALLMGPWVGMVTGLVTNLLWGVISGPVAAAFAPVAMVIGLVAGFAARKGLFRTLGGAVIAGVVITLFVTLVATPIRTYLFGGVTGSGADFFVAYLTAVGQKLLQSVALTVIWTNLADKIVACLVAQAVVRQLPGRIRSLFPGAGNVA